MSLMITLLKLQPHLPEDNELNNLCVLRVYYSKLQMDLKTTKVEELRVQMETFYQEIVRLTQLKMGEIPK